MSTDAYQAFTRNTTRAGHFTKIHADTQTKPGRPSAPMAELPRAAIVFAVGALDSYISEASAEFLVTKMSDGNTPKELRSILEKLDKNLPSLALEVVLISSAVERRDAIYDAVVDHFHNRISNHGSKAVAGFADRIGKSAADIWSHMDQTWIDARGVLDYYTEVRHEIVHQGRKPSVGRNEANDFIEMLKHMVAKLDDWASE